MMSRVLASNSTVEQQCSFGTLTAKALNSWVEVIFDQAFDGRPQVFLTIPQQGNSFITSRIGLVNEQGFTVILQDKANPESCADLHMDVQFMAFYQS